VIRYRFRNSSALFIMNSVCLGTSPFTAGWGSAFYPAGMKRECSIFSRYGHQERARNSACCIAARGRANVI
jgi:hypothetical protein